MITHSLPFVAILAGTIAGTVTSLIFNLVRYGVPIVRRVWRQRNRRGIS